VRLVCLEWIQCSYRGSLLGSNIQSFGERPDAPIAAFVKRLRCRKCGSRSVRAFRSE